MTTPHPTSLAPRRSSLLGDSKASHVAITLAMLVLLTFVIAATVVTVRSNARQRQIAVRARTEAAIISIDDRLAAYEEVLYGVRNGFGVSEALDRSSYHDLITNLHVDGRLPGVQVVGAAHLIDVADIDGREREINQLVQVSGLDYPMFEVHPVPVSDRVLAIDYLEPQLGNERAFGLDFFSEPNRRTAALTARDTGMPAATAPVTLVQETGTQRAILVMLPLYAMGSPTDTVEQRRAAFDGVVYAAFRMGDLMAGVLGEDRSHQLVVLDVGSNELLYGSMGESRLEGLDAGDDRVGDIDVSGRRWRVFVDVDGSLLSAIERAVPLVTLFGGLLVSGLMVALFLSMRSARSRAIALAMEMTSELEALTESANEAIISVDEAGTIVAWNGFATEVFAAPAEQMLGRPVHDLVPVYDRDQFDYAFTSFVAGNSLQGAARSIQTTGLRDDGREFPTELSLSKWTSRGRVFVTGFVRDVSDRVKAEQQLVETSDLLLNVLAAATEMSIIGTDVNGMITVFNAGAERLLGYEASDVVGVQTAAVLHDPAEVGARAVELGIEPGFEVFVYLAKQGTPETREWTYIRSDGGRVPVELTVTPQHDADGVLIGFIGVGIDITERLAANAQQQLLLDQERQMVAGLQELDRVKNDFVSTTSHELRTPLTSIIGYAELLTDDDAQLIPSGPMAMVEMIEKNAQRLLALVEDLLALSRIESGSLHITREPCDLGQIIESASVAIAPIAAGKNITIRQDIAVLPRIVGDAPQLERVLLNLLTNAVKFSHDDGTIDVVGTTDTDHVVIRVTDQGIGIPEGDLEHLFSRFFRSKSAEARSIQGTGLGLSIVANIVQRHGGTVEITSVEDAGTTATVRLPINPPVEPEPEPSVDAD